MLVYAVVAVLFSPATMAAPVLPNDDSTEAVVARSEPVAVAAVASAAAVLAALAACAWLPGALLRCWLRLAVCAWLCAAARRLLRSTACCLRCFFSLLQKMQSQTSQRSGGP